MSDEGIRRLIEEATRESLNQSFVEAGQKYIAAAEALEQKGDYEGSKKLYIQAAEAYEQAAQKYRDSKSYKNAALNMCLAGDVYADIADSEKAIRAYALAAEDLYLASDEHLMWGDPGETEKGTALAVTACLIYIMIGKDDKAFQTARSFVSKNASKLQFPATIRLSQIPQMLESAIKSVNIDAFASAENAVVTELKSSLANANAQPFIKYVEKGLGMAREIIRGQIKTPKISAHLELPVDMTFSEEFPIQVIIKNTGDGDALQLQAEWFLDDGLVLVSGDKSKSIGTLPPNEQVTLEIRAKSAKELMGSKEYQILVKGTYMDMLKTEYSLQAGPGTLLLRDFKMTEKLQHDADVTDGRIGLLKDSIASSDIESEPMLRVVSGLASSLAKAREEIGSKELDQAMARIGVINELVDLVDNLLGDDEMLKGLKTAREEAQRAFAKKIIDELHTSIVNELDKVNTKIDSEVSSALAEWDKKATELQEILNVATSVKTKLSDITAEMDAVYGQLPSASETDDPNEAARRTKIRSAVDSLRAKVSSLRDDLDKIATASVLQPGTRPETPERVKFAKDIVQSLSSEIKNLIEQKQAEL